MECPICCVDNVECQLCCHQLCRKCCNKMIINYDTCLCGSKFHFLSSSENTLNFYQEKIYNYCRKFVLDNYDKYKKIQLLSLDESNSEKIKYLYRKKIEKCRDCDSVYTQKLFCDNCERTKCEDCNQTFLKDHICDNNDLNSWQLILSDAKQCPKCDTIMHKGEGCDDMWCNNCDTAFDWSTLEIKSFDKRYHSPEFKEAFILAACDYEEIEQLDIFVLLLQTELFTEEIDNILLCILTNITQNVIVKGDMNSMLLSSLKEIVDKVDIEEAISMMSFLGLEVYKNMELDLLNETCRSESRNYIYALNHLYSNDVKSEQIFMQLFPNGDVDLEEIFLSLNGIIAHTIFETKKIMLFD